MCVRAVCSCVRVFVWVLGWLSTRRISKPFSMTFTPMNQISGFLMRWHVPCRHIFLEFTLNNSLVTKLHDRTSSTS